MNTLPKRPLQDLPAPHGAGPVNVVGVDGAGCVNSAFQHIEETQALTHFPSPIITNNAKDHTTRQRYEQLFSPCKCWCKVFCTYLCGLINQRP